MMRKHPEIATYHERLESIQKKLHVMWMSELL
jgi:hypothetical protein